MVLLAQGRCELAGVPAAIGTGEARKEESALKAGCKLEENTDDGVRKPHACEKSSGLKGVECTQECSRTREWVE